MEISNTFVAVMCGCAGVFLLLTGALLAFLLKRQHDKKRSIEQERLAGSQALWMSEFTNPTSRYLANYWNTDFLPPSCTEDEMRHMCGGRQSEPNWIRQSPSNNRHSPWHSHYNTNQQHLGGVHPSRTRAGSMSSATFLSYPSTLVFQGHGARAEAMAAATMGDRANGNIRDNKSQNSQSKRLPRYESSSFHNHDNIAYSDELAESDRYYRGTYAYP